MKPTQEQFYKCFCLMQYLSNTLCNVELFRYDDKYGKVYILATNARGEEIEIEVDRDGAIDI
jgi:hypothetical protein